MDWLKQRPKLLSAALVLIFICGICIVAAMVFYPKPRVIGGLTGMIGPGAEVYREDFQCFGIPYDFCPAWPDYGCRYYCLGLPYDRRCSIETFEEQGGMVQTPTECREASE